MSKKDLINAIWSLANSADDELHTMSLLNNRQPESEITKSISRGLLDSRVSIRDILQTTERLRDPVKWEDIVNLRVDDHGVPGGASDVTVTMTSDYGVDLEYSVYILRLGNTKLLVVDITVEDAISNIKSVGGDET